jgi:hypothetical protein
MEHLYELYEMFQGKPFRVRASLRAWAELMMETHSLQRFNPRPFEPLDVIRYMGNVEVRPDPSLDDGAFEIDTGDSASGAQA